MASNREIAQNVLNAVGGKDNVIGVTHCMTRLRFNLKDQGLPNDDEIKSIAGVLGVARSGGQYQVIIGQNVPKVYSEVCSIGGFAEKSAINENLDAPKEKLTIKSIGGHIMNYLAGCMTPLIPVLMAAGMFKTITAVLGPEFLNLISEDSDIYVLIDALYNAAFYFIPILLGYNAAKKLNINPIMGAYMGCILIAPELVALADAGASFTVFGIPCMLNNYSQSVLPIILSVWIMSYVDKFFTKYIPDTLSTVFTPFLTMLVMTPLSLCVLAPTGSVIGNLIGNAMSLFGDTGGVLAVALVAAFWDFLVMGGMHLVVMMLMWNNLLTLGYMDGIAVSGTYATFAVYGIAFGAFLRLKNKDAKAMSMSCFVSGAIGGVAEPTLYGLCFNYKRTFIPLIIAGFVGGLYSGIFNVIAYPVASSNVLMLLQFVGGGTANLVHGCIASALSFVIALVLTYMFGFSKADLAINK